MAPLGDPWPGGWAGGSGCQLCQFPTAYRDLQSREETRNAAWRKRGWDENVYYTGEGTPTYFGDPLPMLGAPCPHLSLLSFPSPADPDHGITDNDSPEDLPPAVIWGDHARGVSLHPQGLPACALALLGKGWGFLLPPAPSSLPHPILGCPVGVENGEGRWEPPSCGGSPGWCCWGG